MALLETGQNSPKIIWTLPKIVPKNPCYPSCMKVVQHDSVLVLAYKGWQVTGKTLTLLGAPLRLAPLVPYMEFLHKNSLRNSKILWDIFCKALPSTKPHLRNVLSKWTFCKHFARLQTLLRWCAFRVADHNQTCILLLRATFATGLSMWTDVTCVQWMQCQYFPRKLGCCQTMSVITMQFHRHTFGCIQGCSVSLVVEADGHQRSWC